MPHLKSPVVRRAYKCQCGRPVFLRNTQCVNCGSQLGYETGRLTMVALTALVMALAFGSLWRVASVTGLGPGAAQAVASGSLAAPAHDAPC